VVIIGDSWMDRGRVGIAHSLRRASGKRYRSYAVAGTPLLGGTNAIPSMFSAARKEDADIATIIMNGGVNEIGQEPGMLEDCKAGGPRCQDLYRLMLDRLSALWSQMGAVGVKDVVYVQYSDSDRIDYDFGLPDGDGVARRCGAVPAPLPRARDKRDRTGRPPRRTSPLRTGLRAARTRTPRIYAHTPDTALTIGAG
jgi:hypothetical protein